MKKLLLSIDLIALFTMGGRAQIIIDTVSVGAGYANQKYYSLQNDEQGTQGKNNWDIGFEITGYAGTIVANTQKQILQFTKHHIVLLITLQLIQQALSHGQCYTTAIKPGMLVHLTAAPTHLTQTIWVGVYTM